MISQRKYTYYSTHSYTEGEVYYYHGDHLGGATETTSVEPTGLPM